MPDLEQRLRFALEWEDPGAAKGDELRATGCRLAITIGETPITRIEDERAQTLRDAVYGPAYPLAEWFAYNWWSLLNEPERPSSVPEKHNLRFAREGFALPSLELFSEDSFIRAVWKPYRPASAPVRFLNEGFAILEAVSTADEIAAFIDKVVARLSSQGVANGPLVDEWAMVRGTSRDESAFCKTVGALGLDPYDLDDQKADEIISISKTLPAELRREFFLAADSATLAHQAKWITKCLATLGGYQTTTKVAGRKGIYTPRRHDFGFG